MNLRRPCSSLSGSPKALAMCSNVSTTLALATNFPELVGKKGKTARREIESEGERPDQSSLVKGCVVRARLSRGNARVGRRGSTAAEAPPVAPHGTGLGVRFGSREMDPDLL